MFADWVIDLGPGGGDAGGRIIAAGRPAEVARAEGSRTAPHLTAELQVSGPASSRRDEGSSRRDELARTPAVGC
jgi:hypothetical protein